MSVRSGWWIGTLMIAMAMAPATAGAQRDGGRAIGWTTLDQIVPVERMREVFTQRIQADPGDVFACWK